MKRAAAIVTNRGGRTCHAAIIARELGIPAVVGCGDATRVLADGDDVTVSCAEGDTGHVYAGLLPIEIVDVALDRMPPSPTKIMMNVGNPELAFEFQRLPNEGVGLARLEFIINRNVGIHPKALLELDRQPAGAEARDRGAHRRLREPDRVLRAARSPKASRRSPRRSFRRRSSCGCRTSSRTSTRTCSAATATSRTRRIRCSAFAARRATSRPSSTTASRSNARR